MREKGSEILIMHVKLYSVQHYLTSIATQVLQGCFYVYFHGRKLSRIATYSTHFEHKSSSSVRVQYHTVVTIESTTRLLSHKPI